MRLRAARFEYLPALASSLLCCAFPVTLGPEFRRMWVDLHTPIAAPMQLALTCWVPLLLGGVQLGFLALTARLPRDSRLRDGAGAASTLFAFAAIFGLLAALYSAAPGPQDIIWAVRW
jgi:hypothetical protein